MRFLLLLALVAAAPAQAQGTPPADDLDAAPEAVLRDTWAEMLGSATAVSWSLDEADGAENPDDAQAALTTAALGSAAATGGLTAALRFSLALADPAQRPQVAAALSDDTYALGGLLVLVAEEASAAAGTPTGNEVGDGPVAWGERADQIRALVGRLEGATKALGIAAP